MRCNEEKKNSYARYPDGTGRQINVLSSSSVKRCICFLQHCNCKSESENQTIHSFMHIYYLAIWISLLFIISFKYSVLSEEAHRNVEASFLYISFYYKKYFFHNKIERKLE